MENRKILFIIDDDEDDQLFLHEAVNDLKIPIECHYANNGESALKQLKEETIPVPDFIFLDLNMPRLKWQGMPGGNKEAVPLCARAHHYLLHQLASQRYTRDNAVGSFLLPHEAHAHQRALR